MSPQERLTGAPPDTKYLRVFGCEAWWNVPKELREPEKKLSGRGKRRIMMSIERYNNYIILDIKSGTVIVSRDVQFNEQVFPKPTYEATMTKKVALTLLSIMLTQKTVTSEMTTCLT